VAPLLKMKMLTIVFVTSVFLLVLVPEAYSAEPALTGKALSFLTDVAMLDVAKCNVTLTGYSVHENYWGYGGLYNATWVSYKLENNESKLDAKFDFADDKLDLFHLYVDAGEPLFSEPQGSVLERAKGFLQRFLTYTGSDCQEMKDTLANVTEIGNVTIASGNVLFELTDDSSRTQFRWRFMFNGAEYYRTVFTFRRNGEFAASDTRLINRIGSTDVNASLEEAIAIAREFVQNLTAKMGSDNPKYRNIALSNEPTWQLLVRTREPMTYYPYWIIGIHFNETIIDGAAALYGVYVNIWADTGEIISSQPMAIIGLNPNDSKTSTAQPAESSSEPAPQQQTLPVPSTEPDSHHSSALDTANAETQSNAADSEHLPTTPVTVAFIAIIVLAAIVLLVYLKKRHAKSEELK
jgi:hypothetical protein